jgi:hypothetical protein
MERNRSCIPLGHFCDQDSPLKVGGSTSMEIRGLRCSLHRSVHRSPQRTAHVPYALSYSIRACCQPGQSLKCLQPVDPRRNQSRDVVTWHMCPIRRLVERARVLLAGPLMLLAAACGSAVQPTSFQVSVVNADIVPAAAVVVLPSGSMPPAALAGVRGPAIIVACGSSASLTLQSSPDKDALFDFYVVSTGKIAGGGRLGPYGNGRVMVYLTRSGSFSSPSPVPSAPSTNCPSGR